MSQKVKVFYVGAKALKVDNVLNRKHLTWAGYGSVQVVPTEDADVYFRYPEVWVSEEDFKAKKKLDQPKPGSIDTGKFSGATGATGGTAGSGSGLAGATGPQGSQSQGEGDVDRDLLIQGAILQLKPNDPVDYTQQGRPRVDRVVQLVGSNVGADEIDAALKALKAAGKLQS